MNRAALTQLIEAAEHALAVFRSLGERGYYPQELLPCDSDGKESPLFMGKQGLMFLINAIKDAKAALPADDGWVVWNGGDCPVSPITIVEYRIRDCDVTDTVEASALNWGHNVSNLCFDAEIVAYRIVKAPKEEQKPSISSWVAVHKTSAGTTYVVCVGWAENYLATREYFIRGRADFEAAEWNHLFGLCDKPDILEYDV